MSREFEIILHWIPDFTLLPKHIFVFYRQNYPLFHSFRLWIMWITLWITHFYRKNAVDFRWITMWANNFPESDYVNTPCIFCAIFPVRFFSLYFSLKAYLAFWQISINFQTICATGRAYRKKSGHAA